MRCTDVKKYLPLYIDGMGDDGLKKKIKEHLDNCQDCLSEYNLLRKIKDNMAQLEKVDLPEGFHEDIVKKLNKYKSKSKYNLVYIARFAIVFIVGLLVGGLLFNNYSFNNSVNYNKARLPIIAETDTKATGVTGGGGAAKKTVDTGKSASIGGSPARIENTVTGSNLKNSGDIRYDKKIIKNAYLTITVTDIDSAYERAVRYAEAIGGFVVNSNIIKSETKSCKIVARVPQEKLGDYIESLKELGDISQISISGDDITRDYMDVDARLRNKEAERDRLQKLMDKATNIDEILKIEEQLSRINTEIDQYITQLKNWDVLTENASVNIDMIEKSYPKVDRFDIKSLINNLRNAFIKSVNMMLLIISKLIIGITYLIIPALIVFMAYYIYKYIKEERL
ncbi:Putative zinc-finger [Caldanaerobius fijiensis DSM 17918]|uniref:Putative zinc-finger n=1 Tax=Caldanaerobius fijiensis DSM 17918 TaxID=1121256 RepID=A0A1M4VJN3_9THEO|nr:DUF4349 domain-containing protein [Caldanaerobius fijiensis]SHE69286.1 Putative zinc-finger [Caldanaerobius fijiensis DSM 17918]